VGDLYPRANVLGVDLSPIQPEWVPPNVKFMVDDVESQWLRPLNHFDYIHARHTVMAIKDWPKLMSQALEYVPFVMIPLHTDLRKVTSNQAAGSNYKKFTTTRTAMTIPCLPITP